MGEFDDADLDGVLAAIDVDNEIANPQLDGGDVKSKSKKSRAKDAKPKREPPKMIRAPDGSSFGTCEACGKRCAAAMLTQYGGFGHECEEVDPTIKLKELAAKERARKDAAKDKFDAAKAAARRELAAREPCKPKSSYQHFCAWRRARLKEEKPDLDPKVLTSLLADEWAKVTADGRVRWEATAAADRELYDERMAACAGDEGEAGGDEHVKATGAPKAKRTADGKEDPTADANADAAADDSAPAKPRYKKARTAFFNYCAHNRARVLAAEPGMRMPDVVKALSAEWQALDAAGKAPFVAEYETEKARLAENPELLAVAKAKAKGGAKRKRAGGAGAGKGKTTEADTNIGGGDADADGASDADGEDENGEEAAETEPPDATDDADGAADGDRDERAAVASGESGRCDAVPGARASKPAAPKARKARVVESDDEDA
ncbi:hypothetical protein KFE25_002724 [Diacronema lutheri]|uniref:HMG box domain-containing protein n=1 Tax=Diacronema lutheri TaxID=2081491 RepID=A0A8J5XJD4_DIALT|nr:hypothetical protein KFE25_002724 [Diacronema lutheri]